MAPPGVAIMDNMDFQTSLTDQKPWKFFEKEPWGKGLEKESCVLCTLQSSRPMPVLCLFYLHIALFVLNHNLHLPLKQYLYIQLVLHPISTWKMDSKVLYPPPQKNQTNKKQFHKNDAECDSVLWLSHAGHAGSAAVSGGPEALLSRPLLSALLRYNSYTLVCLLRLQASGLGFVLYHNIMWPSPLNLHFHNLIPINSPLPHHTHTQSVTANVLSVSGFAKVF